LIEAQKTLQDALIKAQKDYETAIDAIAKATDEKLANLKTKLAELAALMAKLGASQAGLNAMQQAPTNKPIIPVVPPVSGAPALPGVNMGGGTNITINTTNLTTPTQVATAVVTEIKFGQVVTATNTQISAPQGGSYIE